MQRFVAEMRKWLANLWHNEAIRGVVISAVLMIIFGSVQFSTSYLGASLIYKHAENIVFDGTAKPLNLTVDWQHLPSEYWDNSVLFNQIPQEYKVELPDYDPARLASPADSLSANDTIRNEKITYPVVYNGNYNMDFVEGGGSHSAVDIKSKLGTPVYSVANGIVTKVQRGDTGFGNHIVVMFPGPDGDMLFAGYAHLGETILVQVGDEVKVGQQIAVVGQTGFATTPHLHFQIDKDSAPWHPYWPFGATDDFVGSINSGVGIDNAIEYTISPLAFVQQYDDASYTGQSESATVTIDRDSTLESIVETDNSVQVTADVVSVVPESDESKVDSINDLLLVVKGPSRALVGQEIEFELKLRKPDGSSYPFDYRFLSDPLRINVDGANVRFVNGTLTASSFVEGQASLSVMPTESGVLRLTFVNDNFSVSSSGVEVLEFSDVPLAGDEAEVIKYLRNKGIVNGYPDGTFRGNNKVSRVEAIKLLIEAFDVPLPKDAMQMSFTDVDLTSWYANYVARAYGNAIIAGDPTGALRPADEVNLYEFTKLLLLSAQIDVDPNLAPKYASILKQADWHMPYMQEALERDLIDQQMLKSGNEGLTRMQVAEMIYDLKRLGR